MSALDVFCSMCCAEAGVECRHWPSGARMLFGEFHGPRTAAFILHGVRAKNEAIARNIMGAAVTLKNRGASVDDIARRLKRSREIVRASLYLADHPGPAPTDPVESPENPRPVDHRQLKLFA